MNGTHCTGHCFWSVINHFRALMNLLMTAEIKMEDIDNWNLRLLHFTDGGDLLDEIFATSLCHRAKTGRQVKIKCVELLFPPNLLSWECRVNLFSKKRKPLIICRSGSDMNDHCINAALSQWLYDFYSIDLVLVAVGLCWHEFISNYDANF